MFIVGGGVGGGVGDGSCDDTIVSRVVNSKMIVFFIFISERDFRYVDTKYLEH